MRSTTRGALTTRGRAAPAAYTEALRTRLTMAVYTLLFGFIAIRCFHWE